MRRILVILIFSISIINVFGQISINGNSYTGGFPGGPLSDSGTSSFGRDSFFGIGGSESVFRMNGYWYIATSGYGLSDSQNYYILYRTVDQSCTIDPPSFAIWYDLTTNIFSTGLLWPGHPSNSPPAISSSTPTTSFSITGNVSSTNSSSTQVFPDFISLANRDENSINSFPDQPGLLLFNTCNSTVVYNNGNEWKSVWPHSRDYFMNLNQSIRFGNGTAGIKAVEEWPSSNPSIVFSANSREIFSIGLVNPYSITKSDFTFQSSVGSKLKQVNSDYTITDTDHLVQLYQPIVSTSSTFTLPAASNATGREYVLINNSTLNLMVTPSINGLSVGFISPKAAIKVISDGVEWFKLN